MNGVWQPKTRNVTQRKLRSFDNFSGLDAAGANFHPAVTASGKLNPNGLQIRVEPASRLVIRV
jgi:hypothetical protein